MFEAAVDGFDGAVGSTVAVEERQDCRAFAMQGKAEFGAPLHSARPLSARLVNDVGHHLCADHWLGVLVRVDDVLVQQVGDLEDEGLLGFAGDPCQPILLPFGRQRPPGQQGGPAAVGGLIASPVAPAAGGLLDALSAGGELVTSQLHDVEKVMPTSVLPVLFRCSGYAVVMVFGLVTGADNCIKSEVCLSKCDTLGFFYPAS